MLTLGLLVALAQVPCEAPWRALGTTLEDLRVEGDELIVCAHNGGAYPPPDPISEGCTAWSADGGVHPAPLRPRAPRGYVEIPRDGGALACRAPKSCVTLKVPAPLGELADGALRDDGAQALVGDRDQLQIFDAVSGVKVNAMSVKTAGMECTDGLGWVGPFPWARAVECEGPRGVGFLLVGTRHVRTPWAGPPSVVPWSADGGVGWLAVAQHPTSVFRVDATGKVVPVVQLPALDACSPPECRRGTAPLLGITVTSGVSTDVPIATLTPDGGLAVISASGWAIVNPATGAARVRQFTPCR